MGAMCLLSLVYLVVSTCFHTCVSTCVSPAARSGESQVPTTPVWWIAEGGGQEGGGGVTVSMCDGSWKKSVCLYVSLYVSHATLYVPHIYGGEGGGEMSRERNCLTLSYIALYYSLLSLSIWYSSKWGEGEGEGGGGAGAGDSGGGGGKRMFGGCSEDWLKTLKRDLKRTLRRVEKLMTHDDEQLRRSQDFLHKARTNYMQERGEEFASASSAFIHRTRTSKKNKDSNDNQLDLEAVDQPLEAVREAIGCS